MVLRGNNLEIKLGLVFWLKLHSMYLWMKKYYTRPKRGNIPTQINSQILKPLFCDFWVGEALQCEAAVPQLSTVHMMR
jgi:hypothetical protein